LHQHHNILHQALKVAVVNERLLNINPAELVVEKPVVLLITLFDRILLTIGGRQRQSIAPA
jgi:hypothetical protein